MPSPNAQSNIKHLNLLEEFTLHQAVSIWLGRDPFAPQLNRADEEYDVAQRAIKQAFASNVLDGTKPYDLDDKPVPLDPFENHGWEEITISRESLVAWAESKGVYPQLLFPEGSSNTHGLSPVQAYRTSLIDVMHKAIERFWLEYDPSNPPKQKTVVNWLLPHVEGSKRTAMAIDLIIRPDEFKKGGQRKAT